MPAQSLHALARAASVPAGGNAEPLEDIHGIAAITGVGETAVSGPSDRDPRQMALEAVAAAIADAGLQPQDIDGLMVSGHIADQITPEDFHRHFGTRCPLWFSTEGGAMIWAATCAHRAAMAMRGGLTLIGTAIWTWSPAYRSREVGRCSAMTKGNLPRSPFGSRLKPPIAITSPC